MQMSIHLPSLVRYVLLNGLGTCLRDFGYGAPNCVAMMPMLPPQMAAPYRLQVTLSPLPVRVRLNRAARIPPAMMEAAL